MGPVIQRPNRMKLRILQNLPEKGQRRNATSGQTAVASNSGVLYINNATDIISKGTDPGQRKYNYVYLMGIRINHIFRMTGTAAGIEAYMHMAVIQLKGQLGLGLSQNFFTSRNTTDVASGYCGMDFDDATINNGVRNVAPIWGGKYKVFWHKKWLVNLGATNVNVRMQNFSAQSCGMLYVKKYVKIGERIEWDESGTNSVTNPIHICFWCIPVNNGAATNACPFVYVEDFGLHFTDGKQKAIACGAWVQVAPAVDCGYAGTLGIYGVRVRDPGQRFALTVLSGLRPRDTEVLGATRHGFIITITL